jgi:hypothetical protein
MKTTSLTLWALTVFERFDIIDCIWTLMAFSPFSPNCLSLSSLLCLWEKQQAVQVGVSQCQLYPLGQI